MSDLRTPALTAAALAAVLASTLLGAATPAQAGVLRPMPTAALAVLSAAGLSSAAVSRVHAWPRECRADPGVAWRCGAAAVRPGMAVRAPAAGVDRLRAALRAYQR